MKGLGLSQLFYFAILPIFFQGVPVAYLHPDTPGPLCPGKICECPGKIHAVKENTDCSASASVAAVKRIQPAIVV